MQKLYAVNLATNSLSGKQVNALVGTLATEELQTYLTQLETVKSASNGVFNAASIQGYSAAIQGLEARQAALLLSTQGLTNAQIAETLAINESNVANNYQAMVDAGLLKNKKKLTVAQIQENLQTVLGAEADTSAAIASFGLSASIEGQEDQTVKLTAKKLQEAVATNVLTKAQAQEFAMRTGIALTIQKQTVDTLPKWIATLQAGTKTVWEQVKATTIWLATTPQGWGILTIITMAAVVVGIKKYNDSLEQAKQKTRETAKEAKSAVDSIKSDFDSLCSDTNKVKMRYAELAQQIENLGKTSQSRGKLNSEEYEEFLGLSNQLVKLFPQLRAGCDDNGNAILNLSGNVDTIVGSLNSLIEVQQRLAGQEILKEMPAIWAGYMLEIKENKEGLSYLQDLEAQSKNAVEAITRIGDDKTLSIELYKNNQYQADEKAIDDIVAESLKNLGHSKQDLKKMRTDRTYTFMTYNGSRTQTEIKWDFSSLDHLQFKQFQNELNVLSQEYENTITYVQSKIASANSDMVDYINTWLSFGSGGFSFNQLDSNMQNVVRDVLLNSDWINSIPDNINSDNWEEVSNWLQQNFLAAVNNIDSAEIQTALLDAFNGNISADVLHSIINELMTTKGFEKNNPLIIYLQTKLENRTDLEDDVKSKVSAEYQGMIASTSNN